MKDELLGVLEDGRCQKCGSSKVECDMEYPLIVTRDLAGHIVRRENNGKRMRPSQEWMARQFKAAANGEYACAVYICKTCGWSKTYVT